jgi:hypothetical protein
VFHRWFADGSAWDHALQSQNGPAPGYVPGGPNKSYTGSLNLAAQPPQKAYKDWNAEWPENSWEVNEPAIYYQAAYVMLLSRLMRAEQDVAIARAVRREESSHIQEVTVFPNPAHKTVTLTFHSQTAQKTILRFVDAAGREHLRRELQVQEGTNKIQVEVGALLPGTYYLKLDGNSLSGLQKLLIQ